MTNEQILQIKTDINDGMTIREFFIGCMTSLLYEGEGFSGKRPICDSGWEGQLAKALVDAGAIKGKKTRNKEWGYYEYDYEWEDVHKTIADAIESLK